MVESPCSPRDSQESSPTPQFKASILWRTAFFIVQLSHHYMTTGKNIALTRQTFVDKVMQMGISFLFPFAFCFSSFLSYLWCLLRQPLSISFSWGWSWSLPPVQCQEPPSIVLQALCLSDLNPWIYFSLPLYNRKGFDLGHTWMV